jgi:FKBP-type peptidyl-prolyl cis-trans isomerase
MPRKNMYIAVVVAIVVVAVFIFLGFFGMKGTTPDTNQNTGATAAQQLLNDISKTGSVSSLQTIDTVVGTGAEAKAGDTISVNYTGVLPDGTVFDASAQHGQAFSFTLGGGQVIKGWDQGLLGMKVGGTRIVAIPADLAYGNRAIGKIPANSSLIFQVELLSIGGAK